MDLYGHLHLIGRLHRMVGGYTSQLLSLDDAGTFGVKLLVVASFTVIEPGGTRGS